MDEAGPSRPRVAASTTQHRAAPRPRSRSGNDSRSKITKRPPPLPTKPSSADGPARPGGSTATHPHLPIKTLQGVGTRRADAPKAGFGRETIFVTRNVGLGLLIGRGRSLVVDEGYTHLRLYALGAAIPQALILLHALLDTLPYPRGPRGLWYELKTGSVECVDDVAAEAASGAPHASLEHGKGAEKKTKGKRKRDERSKRLEGDSASGEVQDVDMAPLPSPATATGNVAGNNQHETVKSWLDGIGGVEESAPTQRTRIKPSLQIDIYIGPKPSTASVEAGQKQLQPKRQQPVSKPGEGRARPNKKKRQAIAAQQRAEAEGGAADGEEAQGSRPGDLSDLRDEKGGPDAMGVSEEDMMNGLNGSGGGGGGGADEEEEEVEEVEMR